MLTLSRKHWHLISRRFWGAVFTLIIAVAVLVQLGRQTFPLLKDYQQDIATYLGEKLHVVIEVEQFDASWKGLRPKLSMGNVVVSSELGQVVFTVDQVTAELSVLRSLLDRRLSWRTLNFDGFDTTLKQSQNGRWNVVGMPEMALRPETNNRRMVPNDPYDVFLFGRRIKITDAHFSLAYFSGESAAINIPEISLENDRDFHRLSARLDVADERAFSLIVEGNGDPRDDRFSASGYMELNQFPTQKVLGALALSDRVEASDAHNLNVKLWFKGDSDRGITWRGDISAEGEIRLANHNLRLPTILASDIIGHGKIGKRWGVSLSSLQASWDERLSPMMDVAIAGEGRAFKSVNIDSLDVEPWIDLLLHVGVENDLAERVLTELSPSGVLENVKLTVTDKASGYFLAQAKVVDGRSNAVMGAPAFENIQGHVSATLFGGKVSVAVNDGFTMAFPKIYDTPLYFEEAQGQVAWSINTEERVVQLSSGLIRVKNPEEEGHGYFHLNLPFSKDAGEQEMTLAIGIKNTLAKNHEKYVPNTIPKHLYEWLNTSIKKGRIVDAKFLYHGSIEANAPVPPSVQLYGEVYDGNLVFDPEWPELEGVNGSLTLENDTLDVHIDKASLLGNSVYDAAITLVDDVAGDGRALSIRGSLSSDVDAAMTLLKSSPIKQHIGSTFDAWNFSGGVKAQIELQIPLSQESDGVSHKIDVTFSDAKIDMPDIGLTVNNIQGLLSYQTEKGMTAERLDGVIWGQPFDAAVSTRKSESDGYATIIDFSGRVGIDQLYAWTKRPELKFADGESTLLGNLIIPGEGAERPLQVNVTSPLTGVSIHLPEPFGKTKQQSRQFDAQIHFADSAEHYRFTMDDMAELRLLNARDKAISARIELEYIDPDVPAYPVMSQTGQFDIVGHVGAFDLEQWNAVKEQYLDYASSASSATQSSEDEVIVPAEFDLTIDRFLLGAFEIEDLKVSGGREYPNWVLNIESELMAGRILVPETDNPIAMDLRYLRFKDETSAPSGQEGSERLEADAEKAIAEASEAKEVEPSQEGASVLADINLARAVPIDFSAQEFSLGDSNYGSWKFQLRPVDNGVELKNIRATTRGLRVGSEEQGARFVWLQNHEGQSSQFSGAIYADDLAKVFEAWGQEKLLKSESSKITIDARWLGAPDQVTLRVIEGAVNLDVNKGSFKRGAGSDENGLLRLLALFNFDTILRRLRLDFSDLAAQGYSYDRISGNLDFNDGKIFLTEPLIVDSSSSYVQMVGTIDVVNEEIDTDMVVTLPLASSAALATAMVVNLPAALGLYVMSKVFKKQVDRASSLNVEVRGKWEDPKVKVKKIFDIDAAERRGQELKQEREKSAKVKPTVEEKANADHNAAKDTELKTPETDQ